MPEISLRQLLIGALVLALATVLGLAALSGSIPSGLAGWGSGGSAQQEEVSLDPQVPPDQMLSLEMGVSAEMGS
ncbi:hypothetical protein KQ302_07060 [Synechococcus sp. CS-602]|uniref:hypothetical protein n=1 Tax=Synechococcaceae TaxID=1890426 RepID=UPI0008FF4DF2|nr:MULTISPECIES: hypothetical protein [Synechococcaceae]MCT4364615.1 hypothetical protein [Candidatus Regnicoccus frigidus MAG-AL1]APD47797.1 hypothetical protein BM449_05375 [Synechococcus sp. SynAce01]MCT0202870.1 hypothetical protein [Synechococcus sp. CS-603]MCT0204860.1 hypothetical protein [Synechococcus sp. CS-602]MCT0245096.1 hypothetical protein [Synechococcus sp. CS-601]